MDDQLEWKLVILQQLRIRNQREFGNFAELISSHGKLQEQVESLKRTNTRLEYELQEQFREIASGSGSGGGASSNQLAKVSKKVEELQSKMVNKTEELMDIQKKWIQATDQLRTSQDQIKSKDNRIKELLETNRKNEDKISELKKQIESSAKTNRDLIDEHQALHMDYNSQQDKLRQTQAENDSLRSQLIKIKAKDADRLNEENEAFRRKRDEQLKEELRRASEDKGESARKGSASKEDKKRRESSSSATKGLEETVPGPSICPASNLTTFDAHDNEVSALCFSDNGHYMATGGADKVVKVWSWRSSQEKMESKCVLHGNNASIMSVQFDQHSRMVLAASNDYATRIWSISDQRLKHTLTGHSNKVLAAKFLDDNNKVVTGSHDRTLKIWDLQHHTCSRTLFAGSSCNDVVAGRGMGNQVISGHFDKRIRFWDLRTATANEIALQGKVTSLDHFPARHLLLCCSRDDTLRLIDLRQNSITATFSAGGFHVSVDWTRACFSPDGQYVAAGSNDGTLFVWETFTGKSKSKKEHSKEIVSCAWHPKGQLFASADRNKKVVLWKR